MSYRTNQLKKPPSGGQSQHSSFRSSDKAHRWAEGTLRGVLRSIQDRTDLDDDIILDLAESALAEVDC